MNVRIFDVGLRDGLQNLQKALPAATRIELGRRLIAAGVRELEVGAFVNYRHSPRMEGSPEVLSALLSDQSATTLWSLIGNQRGYDDAKVSSAKAIAVFTSASEEHSQANKGKSIEEDLLSLQPILAAAKADGLQSRAYLSSIFGYQSIADVPLSRVVDLIMRLNEMGADGISLGDTVGFATPTSVEALLNEAARRKVLLHNVGLHFHQGPNREVLLECVGVAYNAGIATFDGSIGGIGGCHLAQGAQGNIATEDLVWFFHEQRQVETGINLARLLSIAKYLQNDLGITLFRQVSHQES